MFKKILIANRGEIARRIARTCREMGIQTVAVFSEADSENPYLNEMDEAYPLGPPPARESYLKADRLIKIARDCQANAIHPGYGFLAEDPHFATACNLSGLSFIGPRPETIRAMGKKIQAREVMKAKGIPVIEGSSALESVEEAIERAKQICYPVFLKASGGGGGIGMEVVKKPEQMKKAFEKCRSRAKQSFGDEAIYLEKYLATPRHIEIQIVADKLGNIWHLGERDCSVQRRHQKVIEESPSPSITESIRSAMGAVAIQAASAIDYDSVGTVEMLMDEKDHFYFLEMNTRIQVEHGITELRTGADLIALQIRAAAGEPLTINNPPPSGHSIECRIYAENPLTFFPSCGIIRELSFPSGSGIRIDHSIAVGSAVTPFYDPLLAKVMVWSMDRKRCLKKMRSVLEQIQITGVSTNIPFLVNVLADEGFAAHGANTHLTERIVSEMKSSMQPAKAGGLR